MVKDYFQDIVPPHDSGDEDDVGLLRPEESQQTPNQNQPPMGGDRSIRNININRRPSHMAPPPHRRSPRSKSWIWILAGLGIAALGILALLFTFKQTTITIVPHSQTVVFDESSQFTAYPAGSEASGTIPYTVKASDFDDAEPVTANGTEHKETKATGTITVVNNYSSDPVKLLVNTRFATASGLIFRAPAEVVVPARKGTTPGKVTITVTADQAGETYNIGAGQKLTLPGLQSNAAMYAGISATTVASTTGGFSGDAPAVAAGALEGAKSTIKARLDQKINAYLATLDSTTDLALKPTVTYTDLPTGSVSGGSVQVHMNAHVTTPIVPRAALSAAIAQVVTADASNQPYTLTSGQGFAANVTNSGTVGNDPITFTLSGTGVLVAQVDTAGLASALAGRDQSAFQTIVGNFPGVESAKARIEPFWNSSFPKNAGDINIVVSQPQNAH